MMRAELLLVWLFGVRAGTEVSEELRAKISLTGKLRKAAAEKATKLDLSRECSRPHAAAAAAAAAWEGSGGRERQLLTMVAVVVGSLELGELELGGGRRAMRRVGRREGEECTRVAACVRVCETCCS